MARMRVMLLVVLGTLTLPGELLEERPLNVPAKRTITVVYTLCTDVNRNVTVTCTDRHHELLTSIKSVVMSSRKSRYHLRIFLFVEPDIQPNITQYRNWNNISIKTFPVAYPSDRTHWRDLSPDCSSLKLHLNDLLPTVDAAIYLDASTIILQPLDTLWETFYKFSDQQMFARSRKSTAREDDLLVNQKPTIKGITYAPDNIGVQSGVTLMNLTRIRNLDFKSEITKWYNFIKDGSVSFDGEDLLNLFFYFNLERLYVLPCHFHYTHEMCKTGNQTCPTIETEGVTVLHRLNTTDHKREDFPSIAAVYQAYSKFDVRPGAEMKLDVSGSKGDNCTASIQRILRIVPGRTRKQV